jgi:rhodanese-related sulfurtransferase
MTTSQPGLPRDVPEVDTPTLLNEIKNGQKPLLLDCREPYEWYQGRIPGSLHIPMNEIPDRLHEISNAADIVILCAHGIRSYSVTEYLLGLGFPVRSLRGGIVEWYMRHGALDTRPPAGMDVPD